MNHLSTQTQWWNLINNICEQYLKWFLTFDMSNNNSNNWCLASGMQLRRWGYPLHIGLASLMLLTLDLQRHSAKRTGDVNVMPPLGLEKFCSAPSCGTEHWIYPIGETVRLVSDGRGISASIAVQRGPREGKTVGYCPIPCRLVLSVEPLNPIALILSIACYRGQDSIREIFASLSHIP